MKKKDLLIVGAVLLLTVLVIAAYFAYGSSDYESEPNVRGKMIFFLFLCGMIFVPFIVLAVEFIIQMFYFLGYNKTPLKTKLNMAIIAVSVLAVASVFVFPYVTVPLLAAWAVLRIIYIINVMKQKKQ